MLVVSCTPSLLAYKNGLLGKTLRSNAVADEEFSNSKRGSGKISKDVCTKVLRGNSKQQNQKPDQDQTISMIQIKYCVADLTWM